MDSGKGKVVCVTGASGFIASWLVKYLLDRGYTVRATVRSLTDPKRTAHLRDLDGADERLHLFKADLLEEGSFDTVVKGCDGVFHTASPCTHFANDPQAELIDPAVKGSLNVLASCKKFNIKRVILTSSIVSFIFNGSPLTPDVLVDETWYSDAEWCRKYKKWYFLAKSLGEEAAWKFARENNIDMISIHPGITIGPLLQPTLNSSSELIKNLIGADTFLNETKPWVDVRDVALAHVLAFETPSASGRYVSVDKVAHYSDVAKTLREIYPSVKIPENCADDNPYMPTWQCSKERALSLGCFYTPWEQSLKDTVESLKEKNFVSF